MQSVSALIMYGDLSIRARRDFNFKTSRPLFLRSFCIIYAQVIAMVAQINSVIFRFLKHGLVPSECIQLWRFNIALPYHCLLNSSVNWNGFI